MPIPPPLRRNDHSGIDRSVCGRTASCAFAANNQFYLPFRHFPIGEINSLFLRKFAYILSIVGGIFPRIFHCRETGEKWRKRNHFAANRKGRIEDEREREAVGRKLARRFHFLSICIYEPAWSWKLLSAWKVDARHFDISTASRARFAGFPRRGRVSMEKRKRWWRIFWLLEAKERKWCLWRDVFVKDSLTRSSLPEYYFTWRGFTNLGQRRPPSSSSSFVRLDYATTLFPCLSFLAFLFFPFPFPLSFLSLSRNSPHSYSLLLCPGWDRTTFGRRWFPRPSFADPPRNLCLSWLKKWSNEQEKKEEYDP